LEALNVGEEDNYSPLIYNFYLPALRDCAIDANIMSKHKEKIINATKG